MCILLDALWVMVLLVALIAVVLLWMTMMGDTATVLPRASTLAFAIWKLRDSLRS